MAKTREKRPTSFYFLAAFFALLMMAAGDGNRMPTPHPRTAPAGAERYASISHRAVAVGGSATWAAVCANSRG